MRNVFLTILFLGILTANTLAADFYASTSGSGTTCSFASPCSLQTALNNQANMGPGDTLYLRGGTYLGKFSSALDGGTVRSYPGEWAVIDGNLTTTLNGAINASVTTINLTSGTGIDVGSKVAIDSEIINVLAVSGNQITDCVRGWDGTTAASHSDAATVRLAGNQLNVSSTNTTYRDFEITNSWTNRDTGTSCCGFGAIVRGAGVSQPASSGNNYINLIIHDNLDGLFVGSSSSNTQFYGLLLYNNGMHYFDSGEGRDAGSGNGIYTENSSGYSRTYNVISLNNFNYNGQYFGVSGAYVGGDIQDSVFANAGSPLGCCESATLRFFNILYGPNSVESPTANLDDNVFWQIYAAVGGAGAIIGFGAGIDNATVTDNYFVGGPDALNWSDVDTATVTGNNFFSPSNLQVNRGAPAAGTATWNNNTYHDSQGRNAFGNNGSALNFAGWKSATSFDAASTETNADMPDTVIVSPNTEEAGRCHITIMAPSAPSSINLNLLTCGLSNGQAFTIQNAFDYSGTVVSTGTYNSGSPTISVSIGSGTPARNVATPTGLGFTPATTCPDLCVLVVRATSSVPVKTRMSNARMSNARV